jgi:L-ribulose-5-phosphate 3-epimerase
VKIGITQIILGDRNLDDTLALCQRAGYEALELTFGVDKDLHVDMSDDELVGVARRCTEANVEISSVIAHYAERGNLLSRDAGQREQALKGVDRAVAIAGQLGVDGVLLHPGQLTVEGTYQDAWNDLRDALRSITGHAEAQGVRIGVENVWNKFILSPKEAVDFVEDVGSDWVGIYLDTANMMAYGFPEHWIRGLGSRITKVHFKDFDRRGRSFVNLLDGDTDWPTIMAELRSIGYEGSVIHEVDGDDDAQVEIAERMRRIVAM